MHDEIINKGKGKGNDTLYGNYVDSLLIGSEGNDYIEGFYGNDTYFFAKGHGQETIYNVSGNDTIQFTSIDFSEVKFGKDGYD